MPFFNLQLMDGKDRYIQRFERNNVLSERGSYVIYLPKVTISDLCKYIILGYGCLKYNFFFQIKKKKTAANVDVDLLSLSM